MVVGPTDIRIMVYAPALVRGDARPPTIIQGMERALPGLRLGWTTSGKEDLIPLPHRDEWVAANSRDGGFPFLCNDDDDHLVTLAGSENPNGLAAGSPPHFEVRSTLLHHNRYDVERSIREFASYEPAFEVFRASGSRSTLSVQPHR